MAVGEGSGSRTSSARSSIARIEREKNGARSNAAQDGGVAGRRGEMEKKKREGAGREARTGAFHA